MGAAAPRSPMSARGLAVAVVLLTLLAAPAAAETYTSSQHYYSVTAPSTWMRASAPNVDVGWIGPTYQSFEASINAVVVTEPPAQNAASWLLSAAQAGYTEVLSLFNGTSVEPPRSFTSGSGRPAADYVIAY